MTAAPSIDAAARPGEPLTIERHASVDEVAADWDALADRVGAAPFLRPGWASAWFSAFGCHPHVLAARAADGRMAAVLPLVRSRGALLGAANWHTPFFGPVADGPEAARALAGALMHDPAARTDLTLMDASDPVLPALHAAAAEAGRSVLQRAVVRQPFVPLAGDFASYEALLPRKCRREIARLSRRLADEGRVEFTFSDGAEDFERLLEEGFEIEGSGWKTAAGSAIVSRPETLRFYTDVARWAADHGWLVLAFLRVDGRPVAFDFSIEAGGVHYVLKGGFDPAFRRFGPGVLLTHASLERAFEAHLDSYEFLGVDDPYKLNWAPSSRERVRMQAFRHSPAGVAQLLAWRHGRPVARRALAIAGRR